MKTLISLIMIVGMAGPTAFAGNMKGDSPKAECNHAKKADMRYASTNPVKKTKVKATHSSSTRNVK